VWRWVSEARDGENEDGEILPFTIISPELPPMCSN
jgi:hypothetical protein